jgi:hypothetical protein
MCPKKSGKRIYGKKIAQHVPEKERKEDLREEDSATCARKGGDRGFSERRRANMCPKRSEQGIYGKKKGEHVPEKERTDDLREEDGETCARKGADR